MRGCLNDLFSWCSGTPEATNKTEDVIVCGQPAPPMIESGGTRGKKGKERTTEDGKYIVEARTSLACKLDIKSCGHYKTEP